MSVAMMRRPSARRAGGGEPIGDGRHRTIRLERVAGRDQQPDLVEPQRLQRPLGEPRMAFVRRIERAAKDAHGDATMITEARRGALMACRDQGRSWPWPVTS